MRFGNFLNEVVRAKHTKQARGASRAASLFFRRVGSTVGDQRLKVAIAEAPLTQNSPRLMARNRARSSSAPRTQRTNAFAFVSGGPADVANQFAERSGCIHTRQSVQIAVVGSLADLSAPIDVGNAEAQRQPLEFPIRLALLGSEHLKVARVIHRRLDA